MNIRLVVRYNYIKAVTRPLRKGAPLGGIGRRFLFLRRIIYEFVYIFV